jgi:hypothetical protein
MGMFRLVIISSRNENKMAAEIDFLSTRKKRDGKEFVRFSTGSNMSPLRRHAALLFCAPTASMLIQEGPILRPNCHPFELRV